MNFSYIRLHTQIATSPGEKPLSIFRAPEYELYNDGNFVYIKKQQSNNTVCTSSSNILEAYLLIVPIDEAKGKKGRIR